MSKALPKKALNQRPATYWPATPTLAQEILGDVVNPVRRQWLLQRLANGDLEDVPDELLQPQLSEQVRIHVGRLDPRLMGGEYLPEKPPGTVTVLTMLLQSTTRDVIELWATPKANGTIGLRWVDEHHGVYRPPYDHISKPFSLGELIQFIEATYCEAGFLPLCFNNMNYEDQEPGYLDFLEGFTSIRSDFHPRLGEWMSRKASEWADEQREAAQETEDPSDA